MAKLTDAQSQVILTGALPLQDRTLDILVEKGFIQAGWPLKLRPKGQAHLELRMAKVREGFTRRAPGLPFIESDVVLFDILQESPLHEVTVYRGSLPLVTRGGDIRDAIAILDPLYRWRIEAARTHGKFLKKIHMAGRSQDYGYRLMEAYRRQMEVQLDGKMVSLDWTPRASAAA